MTRAELEERGFVVPEGAESRVDEDGETLWKITIAGIDRWTQVPRQPGRDFVVVGEEENHAK